ncbi:Glutathione S-transferase [Bienertia sinuspersici]
MSNIKVHGSNTSTATLRVVAALHEKQLDFQFVFVNLRTASQKQPSFLSLNGTPLIHKDLKQTAILGAWMEAEAHQFDIPGSALVWELMYKNKIYGQPPKPSIVEENEAKLASVLDVYEARLANSKYVSGDSFTLADLHHLPILHLLMGTKEKKLIDERPRVSAWAKDILARPSWEKTIAMWDKVY